MMREMDIRWSTARATYDLFVDGEWYAEDRDYERLDDMMRAMRQCEIEEECPSDPDDYEEEWEDVDADYSSNAPCDTYGMCAGTSCSHYYQCH